MKRNLAKVLLLFASCLITFLLCEAAARLVLNPADYLSQDLKPDNILGAVLDTHGGGYDEWGFRNSKVPQAVDVVAIGDSHTFGNCAKMHESWPYVLGQQTGKTVYNLALGGYGPNQYFHLFKTKALGLKPRVIICGLYMGDDFENAYNISYGLDHWAYLRKLPARQVDYNTWEQPRSETWHKQFRTWLSRHSVVYKILFHTSPLARLKGDFQLANAEKLYDSTTTLVVKEKNINEAFLPKSILARIDQTNPAIVEGMRITLELLKEMDAECRKEGIRFIVLVIPTKEMVFSDLLEHNKNVALSDVIDSLIANERSAREKTFQFLSEAGIQNIDSLPFLKQSVHEQLYARTPRDMHPGKNGYRVIAGAVAATLGGKQ